MKENTNKRNTTLILSILVIILALVLIYFVAVKPAMAKHDNKIYSQGINATISSMLYGLQSRGYIQIPLSQNKSITLVPYKPQQNTNKAPNAINGNNSSSQKA